MAAETDECRALTALWLGVEEPELDYIDDAFVETLDEAIDDIADLEGEPLQVGATLLKSLYYNRPAVLTVGGVQYVFYFRDCGSAPRYRIPRSSVFRTFAAGSCVAFNKYKMFYV